MDIQRVRDDFANGEGNDGAANVDISGFLAELQRVVEQFLGAEHLFRLDDLVHGRALLVFVQKLERRGKRFLRNRHILRGRIVLEKAVQVVALGMVLLAGKIDEVGSVVEIVRPVAVGGDDGALAIPFGENGKPLFRHGAEGQRHAGFLGVRFYFIQRGVKVSVSNGVDKAVDAFVGVACQHDEHAVNDGVCGMEIGSPLKHRAERIVAGAKRLNVQIRLELHCVLDRDR
ncbi:hypothetical protein SDC9_144475 [bioreactor metagenome]|uniref:Uncharacterized protein n=1 Tax=bioreactor metagenome TaxID=1076179 RepID=A0A645E9J8_9ZZZZ